MSLVCGVLGLNGRPPPLEALQRMLQASAPQGPDGSGSWHDEQAGLGHQMLRITPESAAETLPLVDREARLALTADARLHDRETLCRELGLDGPERWPDGALLRAAYRQWGTRCAERLIGEFAFALWDAGARQLHLVTDPMGIRPLYYREVGSRYLAFASDVSVLLACEPEQPPLDPVRLALLGLSALTVYLEPERTCFEGIHRVPPASVLTFTGRRFSRLEYWRPDPARRLAFASDNACREAFLEVFGKAVAARVRSAGPVASLLSGGLDSSAVTEMARRTLAGTPLTTLSLMPLPQHRDAVAHEGEFIACFAGRPGLRMREVTAAGRGPFDDLEALVATASLCSYTYQHFLYSALVQTASDGGARVVLDGHGGELSASTDPRGYLAELFVTGRLHALGHELRRLDPNARITWPAVRRHIVRPLAPYPLLKATGRHTAFEQLLPYPLQRDFVGDVLDAAARDRVVDRIHRLFTDRPDHRRNMAADMLRQREDIRQRLHAGYPGHHRVAFTYPFLDKRMLEFGLAVDGRFKVRAGTGRHLLRLGMQDLLPQAIVNRTDKRPLCPDYALRYAASRAAAEQQLEVFADQPQLCAIVDFERVRRGLRAPAGAHRGDPMHLHPVTQFLVPSALYLCYFLERYRP